MTHRTYWSNADGLRVGFGPLNTVTLQTGNVETRGNVKIVQQRLYYDQLPSLGAITDASQVPVPAGATVLRATLLVEEAFVSGGATTIDIGFQTSGGVAIDQDGIDVAVAKTAIDAVGELVRCDGALVTGTTNIGTADAYIYTTVATGPYTAGKALLTVEYVVG